MTAGRGPCRHCHGTGLCDQACCTVFGYKAQRISGQRPVLVPACASCRGTGYG